MLTATEMSPALVSRLGSLRVVIFLMLGGFVLVGCASTEFLVHTAKQVRGGDSISNGDGRYKVGSPYQIKGTWYYPAEDYAYSETGIASWYGPNFNGKKTANGETYNQDDLTAAHRTLPLPSAVRVTNLENGRSIVLRINDRGPFARGRIIDVSRQGAHLLGFKKQGVAKVRVDVLPNESRQLKVAAINASQEQITVSASPLEAVLSQPLPSVKSPATSSATSTAQAPIRTKILPRVTEPNLSQDVDILPVSPTGIYVQTGAFSRLENALRMRDQIYSMGPTQISRFSVSGKEIYRVRIGPLSSIDVADGTLTRVLGAGVSEAQLIVE